MRKLDQEKEKSLYTFRQNLYENNIARMAIGFVLGGIGGFLYWKFVGCESGSCAITSNPYKSVFFTGLMGLLLFKKEKRKNSSAATTKAKEE